MQAASLPVCAQMTLEHVEMHARRHETLHACGSHEMRCRRVTYWSELGWPGWKSHVSKLPYVQCGLVDLDSKGYGGWGEMGTFSLDGLVVLFVEGMYVCVGDDVVEKRRELGVIRSDR